MPESTRRRLAAVVRHPDGDLAEAALLCCCELDPDLDVDVELLRLDALADGLRSTGFTSSTPQHDAVELARYLAKERGFTGDEDTYHDPRNGLFTTVLDRRRGLPITLSILYVTIARRLHVPAFGIGLPGHFVTGIGDQDRPVIIDPFNNGRLLDDRDLAAQVQSSTDGRVEYTRAMLRPTPTPVVIRRMLNNLTRDFYTQGDAENALWTVELKHLLPDAQAEDHRVRGDLLVNLGRFDAAARAFEAYLELAGPHTPDAGEIRDRAIRARAKLN